MPRTRTSTYSDRYRDLLEMLREIREAREVVQIDLAKSMGMTQSMLSKLETGVTRIDLPELLSYLDALDQNPVDFLRAYLKRIGRKA